MERNLSSFVNFLSVAEACRKIGEDLRRLIASKYDRLAVAAPARGAGGGASSLLSRRGRLSTIDGDDNRHPTASMSHIAPGEGNFADPYVLASMLQAFLRQSTAELRLLHLVFYSSVSSLSSTNHNKTERQGTSSQWKTVPSSFLPPSPVSLHALEVLRLFAELPTLIQELLESQGASTTTTTTASSSFSCRSSFVTPRHRFSLSSSLTHKTQGEDERLQENEGDSKLPGSSYALNPAHMKSAGQEGGYGQSYVSPQLQVTNRDNDAKARLRRDVPLEDTEGQDKDSCKKRKSTASPEKEKEGELHGLPSDSSHDPHRSTSFLTIDDEGHRGVGRRSMVVSSKSRFLRWLEEALLLLLLPLPGWHPLGAELAVWGGSLGMEFALNTGVLSTADDGLRGCPSSSLLPFSSANQLTLAAKSVCHMLRPHPQSDLLEHLAMINPFYLQQFQVSSMLGGEARKSADAQHRPHIASPSDMNSRREVCLEDLVLLYRLINGEASGRRIGLWGLFCGFCRDVLKDRIQHEKLKRGEEQDEAGETKKNESCPSSGSRNMQTRGAARSSKREREEKKERERKFVLEILQQMEDEGNHQMNPPNAKGDPSSLSSGKERVTCNDENQTSWSLVHGKTASQTAARRGRHRVPLLQQLQLRFAIAVGALDHQLGVLRLPSSSYAAGTERSFLADGGERNEGVFSSERGFQPDAGIDSGGEERDEEEEEEGRDAKENAQSLENKEGEEEGAARGRKKSEKKDSEGSVPGGGRGRGPAGGRSRTGEQEGGGGERCSREAEETVEEDESGEVEEELRRMRDLLYGVYAQRTQFGVVYAPEQKGEDEKEAQEDWEDEGDDGGTSRKRRRKHSNKTKRRGRKEAREVRSRD